MSKGNPIIKCRVPAELLQLINADLAKQNRSPVHPVWTLSDWLKAASREFLRKRLAGRKKPIKATH